MQHFYISFITLRISYHGLIAGLLMIGSITHAQPVLVKDIYPGMAGSNPSLFVDAGNIIFLVADDGNSGRELWKSDGTSEGTSLVKDITQGKSGSFPHSLTNVNGILFFLANQSSTGVTLWKSDGTEAGTEQVKEFVAMPSEGLGPRELINVNGTLFFVNFDGANGQELWKSDGTFSGTELVKDINPGVRWSGPVSLVNHNGTLYFIADNGISGRELWRSDGTEAGTMLVKDIFPGQGSAINSSLFVTNGLLLFPANNGINGRELWKSDGTAPGTELVKDLTPGAGSSEFLQQIATTNNALYWSFRESPQQLLLFRSDGTDAGTGLLHTFSAPSPDFTISSTNLTSTGNAVYFGTSVSEISVGREINLWRIEDISLDPMVVDKLDSYSNPSASISFSALTNVAGTLYYTAYDSRTGSNLRRSDGTGSTPVTDINEGLAAINLGTLIFFKGMLFYAANNGTNGNELYSYSSTPPLTEWRINAGGPAYIAQDGRTFAADQYVTGGNTHTVSDPIAGTEDPELYHTERWGEFSYNLPTGDGTFLVTLHFAETYWGNIVDGGVDSRLFNLDIEGERQLTEYDICAEAGVLTAVQKNFTVTVTDGTLNLDFSKGRTNWPKVSAIEIKTSMPVTRTASSVSASIKKSSGRVVLHPNPVTNLLVISLATPTDRVSTMVTDLTGRSYLMNAHRTVTVNRLEMNVSPLPAGIYLLRLQTGQGIQVLRFIKQ